MGFNYDIRVLEILRAKDVAWYKKSLQLKEEITLNNSI